MTYRKNKITENLLTMKFKLSDIEDAVDFASLNDGANEAQLCIDDGKIYFQSVYGDFGYEEEQAPEESELIYLPTWQDLDLGKSLVKKFAMQQMPDDYDTILDIFSRRGAYSRFKPFLHEKGRLDDWYEYEKNAQKQAIRDWCERNEVELED